MYTMKYKIQVFALAFALVCTATHSQAQTKQSPSREGIRFIPRLGANFSNITLDNYYTPGFMSEDTKLKTGFLVGIEVETPVGPAFYFQPGLLFSSKGAKMKSPDGTLKLSYLEIPLNFYYKPELGDGRLLLGAGPYAAFCTGATMDYTDEGNTSFKFANKKEYADLSSTSMYMRRSDFGLNISAGYEHASGLMLELRAQLGLANNATEINNAPLNIWEDGKFKNTLFSLVAGYRF